MTRIFTSIGFGTGWSSKDEYLLKAVSAILNFSILARLFLASLYPGWCTSGMFGLVRLDWPSVVTSIGLSSLFLLVGLDDFMNSMNCANMELLNAVVPPSSGTWITVPVDAESLISVMDTTRVSGLLSVDISESFWVIVLASDVEVFACAPSIVGTEQRLTIVMGK